MECGRGYAGGFRAPTLKEMYMNFDMAGIQMIYGNPKLKPEKSHNFNLALEHNGQYPHRIYMRYIDVSHNPPSKSWSVDGDWKTESQRFFPLYAGNCSSTSFLILFAVDNGLKYLNPT